MDTTTTPLAFSVRDAARASGISRTELYRQLAAGHLTAIKLGKRTLIRRSDLADFLARLPIAAIGVTK